MTSIYLFTWNLKNGKEAHDLCVEHLAKKGKDNNVFVACLQELPAKSEIATARRTSVQELEERNIRVIKTPDGTNLVRGLALIYHSSLSLVGNPVHDEDGEFIAAVFEEPISKKNVGVVGVHAKSKVDLKQDVDIGGSRALLRHAINVLPMHAAIDHLIVLGDFNSCYNSREVQSWYCFYALSEEAKPFKEPGREKRLGIRHAPLKVVRPLNHGMGTFNNKDSGLNVDVVVDFVAVGECTHPGASSSILSAVSGRAVWDTTEPTKNVSDHLPVEGLIQI